MCMQSTVCVYACLMNRGLPPGAPADSYSDPAGGRVAALPAGLVLLGAGYFQRRVRPGVRSHGRHPHHGAGWGGGCPQTGKCSGLLHAHTQQRRPARTAHRRWVRHWGTGQVWAINPVKMRKMKGKRNRFWVATVTLYKLFKITV